MTHRVADGGARSRGERWFCGECGSHLYVLDDRRPEGVWPNAAALDTELPVPPERVHIMLRFKPDWVPVEPGGERFPVYPKLSIAEWHAQHGRTVGRSEAPRRARGGTTTASSRRTPKR